MEVYMSDTNNKIVLMEQPKPIYNVVIYVDFKAKKVIKRVLVEAA
jgi:hypothetical protein